MKKIIFLFIVLIQTFSSASARNTGPLYKIDLESSYQLLVRQDTPSPLSGTHYGISHHGIVLLEPVYDLERNKDLRLYVFYSPRRITVYSMISREVVYELRFDQTDSLDIATMNIRFETVHTPEFIDEHHLYVDITSSEDTEVKTYDLCSFYEKKDVIYAIDTTPEEWRFE